jgi:hypothetical protein
MTRTWWIDDPVRKALSLGSQKINLQQLGRESTLKAEKADTRFSRCCFSTCVLLADVIAHLNLCGVKLIAGPSRKKMAHEGR